MNVKKYMCLAGLFFPIAAMAQQDKTLCDFETPESYVSVRAYDTCPTSPFNLNKLTGNVQVVDNDLNAVDDALGYAPNESAKILGVQRSRYGSNTFGALVELKEPLALKRETQYVHVKFYSTQDAPVMLIGLGNREDRPWQPATTEQFWSVPTSKVVAGAWQDVVFPIMGADGINIKSLLVVVDRQSPHNQMSDFAVFIDDIILSTKANPFFSKSVYPINYEESTAHTRGDARYVKNVKLGSQSVAINQNTDKKLYFNKTANIFLAKPGETVTPTIDWKGEWMHGYAYLDKDDNGKFDVDYTNTDVTNARDLVSY
ncbi:MAG: glycoside hydrolase family 16 protein, partial [Prevotella sp.]|nr:glycoside hydrolase family 16 protein [Leyella stercorea]MDY4198683.1 glycoside hydrolase family 16 protein [Prevotella sp.]